MAQKTFVDGDVLTASDINTYLAGEGGAWTSYTPTLSQGASANIAKTVNYSKYARYGRTIIWSFNIDATAAGTAGSVSKLTLPVTAAATGMIAGVGMWATATTSATSNLYIDTTTTLANVVTGAVASGHGFKATIIYEAAS